LNVNRYIWKWIACVTTAFALLVPVAAQTVISNTVTNAEVAMTNAAPVALEATNAAAQTAARTASNGGSSYLGLIIWGAVIAGIFAFLWAKGYLVRMRNYVDETQEELKKCSWPSREELKGSTVVVMVTITLLGFFTVGVDWILSSLMRLIT
jgi:preprotein translocase SecE subunit